MPRYSETQMQKALKIYHDLKSASVSCKQNFSALVGNIFGDFSVLVVDASFSTWRNNERIHNKTLRKTGHYGQLHVLQGFSNEDVAKDFLQDILKISIEKISVVSEATTQEDPFHKSVRFDVLVKEKIDAEDGEGALAKEIANAEKNDYAGGALAKEIADAEKATAKGTTAEKVNAAGKPTPGRYFDIELQMKDTGELPKRARYYQSMCDLDALAKGGTYDELREQYILFICPDDIFGKGLSIYRFQNREESDPGILMNDLCYKNFYIFGKYGEIQDKSTREYMQYFATKECKSAKQERIEHLVEQYRMDPITRKAYMTLEQELNIRYKKGVKEGHEAGVAEGLAKGINSRNRELAKAFRDKGIDINIIVESTGLSPDEIKAL